MKLQVLTPTRVITTEEVSSLIAEGHEGAFGILPRHIDYVSALIPGILVYRRASDDVERILAVDRGTLVKVGDEILVSVRDAVPGDDLETLRRTVHERFRNLDEAERQARSALATLEARFIRRFLEHAGEHRG